jgi:hypothetical protein
MLKLKSANCCFELVDHNETAWVNIDQHGATFHSVPDRVQLVLTTADLELLTVLVKAVGGF